MFKSARWRSEKNKITSIFKLQFHATQVSQLAGDGLMISLIPSDVGKPTVKLDKAEVKDGSCYWENSVYETVKFIREQKTGRINERVYHFVLSTGSSKSGHLGEVSIDFANYADSIKVSSVSLPLKNAKFEAVLHVSIQRMQENDDQREIEESENAKNNSKDRSLKTLLSNGEMEKTLKTSFAEDESIGKTNTHVVDHRQSTVSDIIMSSSESSSGLDTPPEVGLKSTNVHQDHTNLLSSLMLDSGTQRPTTEEQQRSQWDWLGSSAPELSTDESSSSPGDNLLSERSQEASEVLIEKLKNELAVFSRQAEMSELELQTLRKNIVKESKRGNDLLRDVVSLKEERDSLKEECENLKIFQAKSRNKTQYDGGDPQTLLAELRQELDYEKNLNANLRIQLQKTQEANSELILAVNDLDEMLEQKNSRELQKVSSEQTVDDEEQKALEDLLKEHGDAKDAHVLEKKIRDLLGELEIYRRDKDELEMQMEQLALDYEILKQENHELSYRMEQSELQEQLKMQYECSSPYTTINELENQIENLENELKNQSKEFSESLATISRLETHVSNLEDELEKQAEGFEASMETLTRAKIEQEQRAIQAEEALRKTRLRNASTAERLQEEFKRLSLEMGSTFEANEKLAMKALTEASELRLQKCHLEEKLKNAEEKLEAERELYEAKLHELSGQMSSKTNQIKQMQSEIEDKLTQLEENGVLTREVEKLRMEIERLKAEKNIEAELDEMKTSMKENETLIQRGILEKNELENTIVSVRIEAAKALEEKESTIGNMETELESSKARCTVLEKSLFQGELEKEKLMKHVHQLKSDLQKKEAFCSLEKKLQDSKVRAPVSDGTKTTSRNNKSAPVSRGSKEADLKEKVKLLETQIKSKESALETSTNLFLEKEKDLHSKIEELERRLDELNQSSLSICGSDSQKVVENDEDGTRNNTMPEEVGNAAISSSSSCNDEIISEKQPDASTNGRTNFGDLLNEIAALNIRNRSMEGELKEMQERYSEISLKFAEVEGERQQLVMTLRNLKNSKRT